jgi:hypothetical protein
MNDFTGGDIVMTKDELSETISNILQKYNLDTDMSFIEKIAKLKFPDSNEKVTIDMLPKELADAAFLPVTTIADIALRQDLDMVVSQIPEWYNALIVTRDAICESDIVDGTLARTIVFDKTNMMNVTEDTIMSKIEAVEDKLRLHSIIKNHIVYNTLFYGEGYVYCVPYAKVFEDLYKYRLRSSERKDPRNSVASMFETSSSFTGYGYGYGGYGGYGYGHFGYGGYGGYGYGYGGDHSKSSRYGKLYGKLYGKFISDDKAYRSYHYYHHDEDDEESKQQKNEQ